MILNYRSDWVNANGHVGHVYGDFGDLPFKRDLLETYLREFGILGENYRPSLRLLPVLPNFTRNQPVNCYVGVHCGLLMKTEVKCGVTMPCCICTRMHQISCLVKKLYEGISMNFGLRMYVSNQVTIKTQALDSGQQQTSRFYCPSLHESRERAKFCPPPLHQLVPVTHLCHKIFC